MKKTILPYIGILIISVLLFACQSVQTTQHKVNRPLPTAFLEDSSAIVLPQWREVFFDPLLRNLIDSALSGNFDLKLADAKIEGSSAVVRLNRGIRLPEINLSASSGARKFGDYTMDGVGNYDTRFSPNINDKQMIPMNPLPDYFIGFQSSWELDLWGKLKSKKKAAAARFISSQYARDLVVTSLISEIASTYYQLIALDRELKILSDNIVLQQSALDMVKSIKESALGNQLAVETMYAQLLNFKATESEVRQQIIECESQLSFLCGTYPENIQRDSIFLNFNTGVLPGVPSELLTNRPDIRQAEHEIIASNADLHSAKMAFYPQLNISYTMGLQSFKAHLLLESPASLAYNLLGNLSAPILNRRKLKADLMLASASQKQAYLTYEKTVVGSFMEVYLALTRIQNTQELLKLKEEEVAVIKQSVNTSTDLFLAGRAGYLEVILAQKNALKSQLELNEYQKQLNLENIRLYRALGGGWK
jgi:NodT family efflux transporter outer membrane factor (OMF) lipoprotein